MSIKDEQPPNKPDSVLEVEQRMVDTAITNLLITEGVMEIGEQGLSIKEQQKRVLDQGYEIIIRRHADPETLYDKIHIKLVKTMRSSTVTLQIDVKGK